MATKKHSVEQIIAKLREVEKLTGQGLPVPMAAKKVGITDQTFYRWRLRYGALKEDEAKRLPRARSISIWTCRASIPTRATDDTFANTTISQEIEKLLGKQ